MVSPRLRCSQHIRFLVLFDVFSGRLWERYFSGIVKLEQIGFDYVSHQANFKEILNPPPYQAIDPDIHGEYVGLVVRESHRVDVIDFGSRPGDGEDGRAGQGNAASH